VLSVVLSLALVAASWTSGLPQGRATTFDLDTQRQAAESSATPTVAYAKGYARRALGPVQYRCLDRIATYESHWNPLSVNRTSGAYGIPQALPGYKMRSAGKDWKTNPVTQVKWMMRYLHGRYGSACEGWNHILAYGWY
jgi:hypothetical protein